MSTPIDIGQELVELGPRVIGLRRELHQHPELAFEEVRTAAILAGRMRGLGLAVGEGIGGTGVVAVLEGGKTRQDPSHPGRYRRAADGGCDRAGVRIEAPGP